MPILCREGESPWRFSIVTNQHARSRADRDAILARPSFGQDFTDHMVRIEWSAERGWDDACVVPYGQISLDPSASVLHYGQEVFEGVKAYRHPDGSIWAFRPEQNARRFQHSARRVALPALPVELFVESIRHLVAADAAWVPSGGASSLYLRPFMFASEGGIDLREARKVSYILIACPVGALFANDSKSLSIWLSTVYRRATPGGTGAAKTGGNYAASMLPQRLAREQGCDQVLFLDAIEGRYLEELGGMNIVLVRNDGTLITPSSDSILEGITRDSVLQIAEDLGLAVERRRVSIDEWRHGVQSGQIVEAFACGTAAAVASIAHLKADSFEIGAPDAPAGRVATMLRRHLLDIQYGRATDKHSWLHRLD